MHEIDLNENFKFWKLYLLFLPPRFQNVISFDDHCKHLQCPLHSKVSDLERHRTMLYIKKLLARSTMWFEVVVAYSILRWKMVTFITCRTGVDVRFSKPCTWKEMVVEGRISFFCRCINYDECLHSIKKAFL